ncbi:methyltransferase family protein [Natranaerovirga hydrolytica]|uniref:Methyltransferase family protein n=1 Tax=Natranaerovirga hydrolytica TaxID=680378 RepID=A0A4V6NFD6_9FIRM|nr:methyltransferase domain-containing protein [Natranaerovirga hydrolytica]TCK93391.1 methyltransferase family protein [Natranaerovirga hydrolytica]
MIEHKKSMNKKVLVIAYAFPPIGGSGIQRTLKFVKYLKNYGWEPVVLTAGQTGWKMKDQSLLNEVPKDIQIIRIDDLKVEAINQEFVERLIKMYGSITKDYHLLQEYIGYINTKKESNAKDLFVPEYQSAWALKVIETIEEHIDMKQIDLIYTSADPYADTFIAYDLKNKYELPWVADFRDEWTNHHYKEYDKNSIMYKMEYAMEKNIVKKADVIVTTTPISSENYRNRFDLSYDKVKTITNGYDEADFENISIENNNSQFTIMHNGLFHNGKNPLSFLHALANLIEQGLIEKEKIKVLFTRNDYYFKVIKALGLEDVVEYLGYLEHKKSLEVASQSTALLLIVGEGDKLKQVHAAKLFEYLRLCKPILSLAPKEGVIDEVIKENQRGYNVPYADLRAIEKNLLKLYKAWEENTIEQMTVTDKIQCYERKYLTKQLVDVFNTLYAKQFFKVDKKLGILEGITQNNLEAENNTLIHTGRRGKTSIVNIHTTPFIKKEFNADTVSMDCYKKEKEAYMKFGEYSWFPQSISYQDNFFIRNYYSEDTRLDKAVQKMNHEEKEKTAGKILSIILDLYTLGYAHRDIHAKNIYYVDNHIKLIDYETIGKYTDNQKPSFIKSYDITGKGLESPLYTRYMCYLSKHPLSILNTLEVPLDSALIALKKLLYKEVQRESLTFKKKQGRHTTIAKKVYCSFQLKGFQVLPEHAQRNSKERFEQFQLTQNDMRDKSILDLGSNIGGMIFESTNFCPRKAVGIEYDSNKVKLANRIAAFMNLPNISFKQYDIDELEQYTLGESFDVVFCLSIEAHIKNNNKLYHLLGHITNELLLFEGNASTNAMEVKKMLLKVGFNKVEYLGTCNDDFIKKNNCRPLLKAWKNHE